jgi:glutathione S-transferase
MVQKIYIYINAGLPRALAHTFSHSHSDDAPELKLTETSAIMRHIGERFGKYGTDPHTRATVSMLESALRDANGLIVRCAYGGGDPEVHQKARVELFGGAGDRFGGPETRMHQVLSRFEAHAAKHDAGPYLLGHGPLAPDFWMFELLMQTDAMAPGTLEAFPTLTLLVKAMRADTGVSAYLESEEAHFPFNNPHAIFR